MEWTETATRELEGILDQLRASLDPQEVDIDEVADDIQTRIEAELATGTSRVITADSVRAAAARIGVQEMVPDQKKTEFVQALEKPKRIRKGIATGWFWFTGIILPLVALGTEAIAHLCLDAGLVDPIPTPFHALLIAVVPLTNLLGWLTIRKKKAIPEKWLGLLAGIAVAVAAYNTLLFATLTPFAIMGFAAIIYFGIGLLCFLPLSPLLSLAATFRMWVLLKRHFGQRLQYFRNGILIGLSAILLCSAPMYLTKIGLTLAASDQPGTQLKGIRLLRMAGDEVLMNRACYWGANMPTDPISWLINGGKRVKPDQARDIYYRVTGSAFNTVASPTLGLRSRRNPGEEFDWDPEQGGDVVAGRLKGLSLTDSRMDGVVDEDAATAYIEWTMVFQNDWKREREARAQIALPPGAVVSRLTLWIDGEEREAAFGGRSQVKQAYKKVVRRRRDPVLVTTSGPDRVLMQCYPVPASGDMKIRIGITAPLALLSESERALRLPHLHERNFRIPESTAHAVWLKGGESLFSETDALGALPNGSLFGDIPDLLLNGEAGVVKGASNVKTSWAASNGDSVVQQIQPRQNHRPDHIAIVIDGSVGMKAHRMEIASALEALPRDVPVSILLSSDEPVELARAQLLTNGKLQVLKKQIQTLKTTGGQDNGPALRDVWKIPYTGNRTAIVWVHGPQPWKLNSGEPLRQVMERQKQVELIDFQIGHGPHRLAEQLGDLPGFRAAPRFADTESDLKDLFRSLSNGQTVWEAKRFHAEEQPADAKPATDHLVRLFAWDRIRADLADGIPGNEEALRLALKHHLVTPVSGAVVLETKQQFDEANLKPVSSSDVPSVPEPGTLVLFAMAALLVFYGRRIVRRIRIALHI
ncbi:hypothetical protein PDESU_02358 [Pontiella desulfatans]|uniref:VIT domain-containing protein n=1 Tax=Pontiella desulfatans TaxID=2750659 RepID=A0A6C2U2J7_PONDE|nr:VIT domain-containing protein [Pontiella desulfatans]VGO13801.1 hypothetical protein PDESU_02358 [Pontiella desulfatans]